jgi:hypothetical protein
VMQCSKENEMTTEEKIAILVADDIISIETDLVGGDKRDCSYLWAVLTGEGFTQYNHCTAEEIDDELKERWDDIVESDLILPLAHRLNGEPINLV